MTENDIADRIQPGSDLKIKPADDQPITKAMRRWILDNFAIVDRPRPGRVVIDLCHRPYLDSRELAELVACARASERAGVALVLENVGEDLWHLLLCSKLDTVLQVERAPAAATEEPC